MEALFSVPIQGPETDERFTPAWLLAALGETYDTDPASPVGLDTFVPATTRYTREDDGLLQPWHGFVWCNPPFSNATPWAERFIAHGNGIWLGPVANSRWFLSMLRTADAIWHMKDFAFVHPSHAGKRASMPLCIFGYGDRATAAVTRASQALPDAGVLLTRLGGTA
jgi:hypothetical protein